ncbi:hypothetical protein K470DRAFT_266222 [Piedraia hortae CBS 480.64]|uniref:F-box domain-containing protein n=1 Tax=Piedraia hortae CBS 480.64 TaxID=1314780 RepID=A0A6A7BT01_9PEZI|nr:hypothetical protein K470DRAFT_266222 [Piedraia hortae CBS 480.64]
MATSLLLSLPPELRNAIYEYVLASEEKISVAFRLEPSQGNSYRQATHPALTRVNRQIRYESLPVYFARNSFVLCAEGSKAVDARRWLEANNSYLDHLRRVCVWVRYVTPAANGRAVPTSKSRGAVGIFLRRRPRGSWSVDEDWCWVTVLSRPAAIAADAAFLIGKLRFLLQSNPTDAISFVQLLSNLKEEYIKNKTM